MVGVVRMLGSFPSGQVRLGVLFDGKCCFGGLLRRWQTKQSSGLPKIIWGGGKKSLLLVLNDKKLLLHGFHNLPDSVLKEYMLWTRYYFVTRWALFKVYKVPLMLAVECPVEGCTTSAAKVSGRYLRNFCLSPFT